MNSCPSAASRWNFCVWLILLLVLFRAGIAWGADYFPPPDNQGGWRTVPETPQKAKRMRAAAGMDLARLGQAFDLTQRCTQNGGLLVVRHGYLVLEKYFGR